MGKVLAFAEEAGEVGAQGIDEVGEFPAVIKGEPQVIDGAGDGTHAHAFGDAGLDQFPLAVVQIDAAVAVDDGGDLLKLGFGEL